MTSSWLEFTLSPSLWSPWWPYIWYINITRGKKTSAGQRKVAELGWHPYNVHQPISWGTRYLWVGKKQHPHSGKLLGINCSVHLADLSVARRSCGWFSVWLPVFTELSWLLLIQLLLAEVAQEALGSILPWIQCLHWSFPVLQGKKKQRNFECSFSGTGPADRMNAETAHVLTKQTDYST